MAEQPADGELDRLLQYLKDARGFDFTGYKRASIYRRVQRRMQTIGVDDFGAYLELLEANPGEFAQLFDTILINVTGFVRDREAWEYLRDHAIAPLADERDEASPVRVWSAGTASGEEAYSLAVLLAEALGEERFLKSVKIYATDVDNEALVAARHGRYATADVVAAFGEERAERFFEREGTMSVFRQDLRRSLIFGRHDLVQDPPISRIDLLVCRNTLMYFGVGVQRRALASFQFALADGGFLFLGKAEAIVGRSDHFQVASTRYRIFRKLPGNGERLLSPPLSAARRTGDPGSAGGELLSAGFEESPVAQMVLDAAATVVALNRHARRLFGLGADSAGRPLKDLVLSYRPVELRSLVEQTIASRNEAAVHEVAFTTASGAEEYLDVLLHPWQVNGSQGVTVTFMEVGRAKLLRNELERSQRELESAYEELQSTVEELETTNEELQSTNEELETTNEELHSANEELETMNEELQSTNEELESANAELRVRSVELHDLNRFLGSILDSLSTGVGVLGRDMTVRAWNRRAEDLWGVRADEVEGTHFLSLDIGLPIEQLRGAIRATLQGSSEGETLVLPAINRRGRSVQCTVQVTPLKAFDEVFGVMLVMND